MSPEGAQYAIEKYLQSLQWQKEAAEFFFANRWEEGMDKLEQLPCRVREEIDQKLWEVSLGQGIDVLDPKAGRMIAEAVIRSIEERMGMGSPS
jgi:hypothetical protein